ncbi:MAG: histidine--tRNA ligase [Melioribacteraceae bacterium]|nr:histidine--tRNA ligase [Melioribacteraceae bacterium]MCF8354277.1 histidine--tRNA ligase [Melioribacteraceae bacterium]MCF8394591.1 histidine--tRNA ligase [Melioribacteraceae bacterium]MCF8419740.1 histidine--tRNA ligase [Melioribacteraceae bacterium]
MIKAITGTKDILPDQIARWHYLEMIVSYIMECFNYKEIRTPVFEETSLFARGIGEATDIVSKEMYTFIDRSETSVTLKPEMTASVVRALNEHSLDKKQGLNKLYYISPMFRQERPQAGRYRQFHQFGAEAIGSDNPALDAEMIVIAYDILKSLGLNDLTVKINSLGVPVSRENYKNILREYLTPHLKNLSEDSQKRFETNILRIFDSKAENDQKIMEDAPLLIEHLDDNSLENFEKVKQILLHAQIPFEIDPKLVRGLDYYTHTTFEILSGSVGSQSALCGGGRYDGLSEQLGGTAIPGVGFAAGIERILLACENEKSLDLPTESIDLYLVRLDKELQNAAYNLSLILRRNDLVVELDYLQRSVKAQMREANKFNAKYVLFIGGEEYERNEVVLKNMSDGEQQNINLEDLSTIISKIIGE